MTSSGDSWLLRDRSSCAAIHAFPSASRAAPCRRLGCCTPHRQNRRAAADRQRSTMWIYTLMFALFAAFAVAPAADAGVKRLAWKKVTVAWTAEAKKHGAVATCDRWGPQEPTLSCLIRGGADRWEGSMASNGRACGYRLMVTKDRGGGRVGSDLLIAQNVDTCERRWWLRIASPWRLDVGE